jgi:hypothetical protein
MGEAPASRASPHGESIVEHGAATLVVCAILIFLSVVWLVLHGLYR